MSVFQASDVAVDELDQVGVWFPATHDELVRILEQQASDQTPVVFAGSWAEFCRVAEVTW